MSTTLRALIVEDNAGDAELMLRQLRRSGFTPHYERVETEADLRAALAKGGWDIVLSDFALPNFNGLDALKVVQGFDANLPFIIISGTIGEEVAVDAMKAGAHDYLLKGNLARLGPAIERELREAEVRRQRQAAERALKESQDRYQALVETASDWVWEVDAQGRYTYASPRVFDLLGYRPEEILGRTPFDLMPAAEAARVKALFREIVARKEPFAMLENINRHRGGHQVVLETSGVPILTPDGQLQGYRGMDRDVTARKQAEDQLRKLARAVEQSPVSIVITDREGRIEFVNPKFTEVTGYQAEEVMGLTPRLLKSGEMPPGAYEELWKTITAGHEWRGEFHNKKKDGALFWETASISPVRDAAGQITHFIAVKEDVTEKRLIQAKLLRAQRVESIGSLASGIAHDLNNIMTPIVMCAPMLQYCESPEEQKELVQTIEASAQRAVGVVKQLLGFARGKEGQKQPVQVRHLMRDMTKIVRETFPRSIQVEDYRASDLWPVLGDATQIHQVLLNLCVNARDAMPNGGILSMRAENVMLDEHFAGMNPQATPGPYVRLEVRDTGLGIPEEFQARIFESFFTTKGEGQGTGLGLTTVQGIVKDHKGFITFTSAPGKGTSFIVHLPAILESVAETSAVTVAGPSRRGNGELVLVVDDEPSIRETTRRSLERQGYTVLEASDGIDGLAQFSMHQAEIRAVIADFMMPLMDGATLSRAIQALSPHTPIIISSGGLFDKSSQKILQTFAEIGVRHILQKPHTAEVLLHALTEVLGKSNAPASPAASPGALPPAAPPATT